MIGTVTWKELRSQPDAWERLLARINGRDSLPAISLGEMGEVLLLGSGSSYYLALAVADWIERRSPIRIRVLPSCEVMLDPERVGNTSTSQRRLAVAFSRSGESTEALLAVAVLKRAGFEILSVSCQADSSVMRMADHRLPVSEGREDGLVMLRSFTGMLIAAQVLFGGSSDLTALSTLPRVGRSLLGQHEEHLKSLARSRPFDRFVFLGSGPAYPIALEASLKVQEMACTTSEAYHTLEYRHGPKATATSQTLVTIFGPSDIEHGVSLAQDMKALGAAVMVVAGDATPYRPFADLTVSLGTALSSSVSASAALLPAQIVACETAMRVGNDPDAPVNLSKVVVL
ncbi:MAG: SIS domain-containing protein [Vicinamibacterales bacterium]